MTLVVLALAAGGIGAWLRRWWLLALPPAAAVGAGFLLVMPGSHVTSDNPLPFLLVVVEAALAIGIVVGGRLRNSAKEKACDPALSADGRGQSAGDV